MESSTGTAIVEASAPCRIATGVPVAELDETA
jgi:hypothetical protein